MDNTIVKTGHKVEVLVIRKLISDTYCKFSNIKYCNAVLDNIIMLLGSKFNLIGAPVISRKEWSIYSNIIAIKLIKKNMNIVFDAKIITYYRALYCITFKRYDKNNYRLISILENIQTER